MNPTLALILIVFTAIPVIVWAARNVKKHRVQKDFEAFKKEKFVEFIARNEDRVRDWNRHHKPEDAPIYWDARSSDWVWLNRQQKKQIKKMGKA